MMATLMSRRVLLLGPLPPPFGGVSIYMSFLLEHLRPRGVGVWAYFGESSKGEAGVHHFRHRRLGLVPLAFRQGRGARVLDVTHFHLEHPNLLLLPAWLVCKLVLRFRWHKNILDGTLPARHREFNPLRRLLFRWALREADEFVVVSEELKRWLRDDLKVRQKVTVIPCLVPIPARYLDEELTAPTEAALQPYLRRTRHVCSVGAFIHDYGFMDVARAVERLRAETGEDIGLALLDGAFAREDSYRSEVLAGREWITVLEQLPNPDVYKVMRASDAFIRAVAREGYGISRVEALWCGLPVVATRTGETRGMMLYDFGNVDELVQQLKLALFTERSQEVKDWATLYQKEAEDNLERLLRNLGLDE